MNHFEIEANKQRQQAHQTAHKTRHDEDVNETIGGADVSDSDLGEIKLDVADKGVIKILGYCTILDVIYCPLDSACLI